MNDGVVPGECPPGHWPVLLRRDWSHCANSRAGVGIVVQDRFLSHFDAMRTSCVEIARAAVLRLTVVYFAKGLATALHTAEQSHGGPSEESLRRQRANMHLRLAAHCPPAHKALTITMSRR